MKFWTFLKLLILFPTDADIRFHRHGHSDVDGHLPTASAIATTRQPWICRRRSVTLVRSSACSCRSACGPATWRNSSRAWARWRTCGSSHATRPSASRESRTSSSATQNRSRWRSACRDRSSSTFPSPCSTRRPRRTAWRTPTRRHHRRRTFKGRCGCTSARCTSTSPRRCCAGSSSRSARSTTSSSLWTRRRDARRATDS